MKSFKLSAATAVIATIMAAPAMAQYYYRRGRSATTAGRSAPPRTLLARR